MGARRGAWLAVLALALAPGPCGAAAEGDPLGGGPTVAVSVEPREATVGDRLALRVVVTLPAGARFEPPRIGPALGAFTVLDGSWGAEESVPEGQRFTWSGSIVTFRTGDSELPTLSVTIEDGEGRRSEATSEAVGVSIRSVLDPAAGQAGTAEGEIADLKPPASLPPDYRALYLAAGILALLLAGSTVLWWLHRRYAARLTGVPAPHDPFHRTPPHEWVYAELQKLLERRLPEQGQVPLFFAELSQIVKRYLGGRYRVDLLERTTAELPRWLAPAGAEDEAVRLVLALLGRCDLVKFAGVVPDSEACRAAIEEAYRIVDVTRPRATAPAGAGALPGAA